MRLITIAAATAALVTALPLAAQNMGRMDHDPTNAVKAVPLPAGWHMRMDDKDASKQARFVAEDGGYHVTSGGAAIYYRSKDMQPNRSFSVSGDFVQTKPTRFHGEAYGLFFGGHDLANPAKENYYYFEVRQNGDYLINHRAGTDVHKLVDWTVNDAIHKPDASGVATNALRIEAGADSVRFFANGTEVAALSRATVGDVSGDVGLRVNHNLDVKIENFAVTRTRGR
jgi:hypothetical protein